MVEEALGADCSFEAVRSLHENLVDLIEDNKDVPDPVTLSKGDVTRLLSECGAPEETLPVVETHFENAVGEQKTLLAANVTRTRSFEVKTPEVTVQVKPDRTDLLETRMIDGRAYLLISLEEEVTVNGIRISRPTE